MIIIEVDGLTRTFKDLTAVDHISFAVEAGEIFGLLGHNGAGKTTTIRMLTGQLRPTGGQARVAGCDVLRDSQKLKALIGVVPEYQNLYERMSAGANLAFAAQLYNQPQQVVTDALDRVGLLNRAQDKVSSFSNGMKQRLLLARALLHQPTLLFLDEPTRGLDPVVAADIRRVILDLSARGITILLTTHYMAEADQLCNRVAFLNDGRIAALDHPANLKVAHGQRLLLVTLADDRRLTLDLDDPQTGKELAGLLASGQIQTIHSAEATLEEVFIKLVQEKPKS
jgi:ABC-2 type transport system ATP-binding protein